MRTWSECGSPFSRSTMPRSMPNQRSMRRLTCSRPGFSVEAVRAIRLDTFKVAYQIIGGGEEGDKRIVRTKEEADHSLPYMLAAALIDGQVQPEQYAPERIVARDVQDLLRAVTIT